MIHALMSAAHQARIRYGKRKTPFLGEVSAADFITGNALAAAIGLTQGTAQYSDAGWLKFKDPVDGHIKFVAKCPLRRALSWNAINGQTYRVRLLKALGSLSTSGVTGYDHPDTHGSEWNRLMYHISGKPFVKPNNTLASEGIDEGDWASYSETDLAMLNTTSGSGAANWSYEKAHFRGHVGVSYLGIGPADNTNAAYGWRPVLELVE